jgi:hypothetical protein
MNKRVCAPLLLVLLLAACRPAPRDRVMSSGPTAVQERQVLPSATLARSPTAAPTLLPTAPPLPTLAPTATRLPSPSPSPYPDTPTPALAPSASPAPTVMAQRTFTDTAVGYAIDYPATWFIQPDPGMVTMLTSWDMSTTAGKGGVPADRTKIDIVSQPSSDTLDTLAQHIVDQGGRVTEQRRLVLPGGLQALRLQLETELVPDMSVLITQINGYSVRLYAYGDQRPFDGIARTLRAVVPR